MKLLRVGAVAGAAALVLTGVPAVAGAGPASCDARVNNTSKKLLECVTVDGVRGHQAAFQAIADANGGTRQAGTPGYAQSAEYVASTLEAAGYEVTLDPFEFTFVPPAVLDQLTPVSASYETGAFTGSGSADVTGQVIPVDLALGMGRGRRSGIVDEWVRGQLISPAWTSPARPTSRWSSAEPASSPSRR